MIANDIKDNYTLDDGHSFEQYIHFKDNLQITEIAVKNLQLDFQGDCNAESC